MLVLADALTRAGYAVLCYDKRGAGKSTGNFDAATMADLTADAAKALAYLRSRPDIDRTRIGLIGHSEGGTIATVLAADDPHIAYVVMMAGFAAPAKMLVAEQIRRIDVVNGTLPAAAAQTYDLNMKLFGAIADAKDQNGAEAGVRKVLAAASPPPSRGETDQALMFARMPAMRYILAYDPTNSLRRVRVPVLALAGSKDLVVPPDINLPALRKALAQDRDVTIVELPDLNHFFQTARTGAPQEFSTIEETLSPQVTATMIPWIARHVTARR
jgi:pimeloyl-ACP methyl ester carboxylesterase